MPFPVSARPARPASAAWNLAKTLVQTAVFWSVFLFLFPALILQLEGVVGLDGLRFEHSVAQGAGIALFALGGTLGLTSGVMVAILGRGTPMPNDCPRELVIAGPYRFVRNPMAVAGIAQGAGVGLFLGSPAVVAYALLGAPVWQVFVRPWEEADLERRFGEPYRRYRASVRCWWPSMRGFRPVD